MPLSPSIWGSVGCRNYSLKCWQGKSARLDVIIYV